MTDDVKSVNPRSVDEIKTLIQQHGLGPDSKSYSRALLIEGFEHLKNRIDYNQKLQEAGNISVDVSHTSGWIHNLIRDTLGGQIDNVAQKIFWIINNKRIEFDPYSGEIGYAE